MKMAKNRQCGPDETSCPAGCCPEANWFCCPDNMYCAATAADCPFVAKKAQLMKMAKNRQCGPDETSCPAGCCPEANWFCCPDNMYCAATAADCPFVAKKEKLMKMAAKKPCAQLDVAQKLTGTAALTTCTVLLLLLIVHLLLRSTVREPCAQLDVALKLTGTAALTTCTVPLLLLIVHLLPRKKSS